MEAWLTQHFFNPAYVAGGAALVASPIIIHLINRMRFRRVRFAAMEFLLQSQQRNRHRVLFEQLLLLLVRILIVLAIVALISRLILDPSQMSIFRGAKAHHVILLDDSGSMRDRWGETNAFEQGLDVVKKLVAEGARRPDTQRFSLLLLSNPEHPLFSQRDVNESFINELESKLENARCSHRSLDLISGLDAAQKLLAEEKATIKHLHVISDFRERNWQDQKAVSSIAEALDTDSVTMNFVRTVSERHQNLAVTKLTGDVQVAAAGVPVRLSVTLKNFGDRVAQDIRLSVIQDGKKLPMSIRFEKIEAGEEIEREFDISFDSPQKHQIQVELASDSVAEDNTRYLAIDVPAVNKVLIVDGTPANDEGSYLADALAADPSITGNAPQIETVEYLRRPLDEFQSIFLLNIGQLPPNAVQQLQEYVAAGGGLAWFVGDSVQPAFYNDKLFDNGRGVFPVRLAPAIRELPPDESLNPRADLLLGNSSIFSVFQGQENPYLDATRVYSYFPVSDDWVRDDQARKDGVATVALLRNKQPLMFTHRFGSGQVFSCLTTCGPIWNNLAKYASFVVLQLELQKYIARTDRMLERRIVGEAIRESLDPAEFTELVEVSAPVSAGQQITRLKAAPEIIDAANDEGANAVQKNAAGVDPTSEPIQLTAVYRDTDIPGIYTVKLLDLDQVPTEKWIAYNVPSEESDLKLASRDQIQRQIGDSIPVRIQEPGNFQWIAGKDAGQDVREWLIAALVLLLVLEQVLAYKMSYHPQLAGARA